jgi:hypothetical protein
VSDDGHREWVQQNKDSYTGVKVPIAFLSAHVGKASHGTGPTAPKELDRVLMAAWNGAANSPGANTVTVACRIEQLPALAEYVEACMTEWVTGADLGHGVDMHIAAATALAANLRHTIRRERD